MPPSSDMQGTFDRENLYDPLEGESEFPNLFNFIRKVAPDDTKFSN